MTCFFIYLVIVNYLELISFFIAQTLTVYCTLHFQLLIYFGPCYHQIVLIDYCTVAPVGQW